MHSERNMRWGFGGEDEGTVDFKCKERLGTKRDPFDLASKKSRHLASGWIRALRMHIHNATDLSPPSSPYYLVPKKNARRSHWPSRNCWVDVG